MEVIGIHKEDSNLRIACISQVKGEVSIEFLEKQRDAFFSKKDPYIVTGIEGQDLLLRRLKTPLKKQRALHKTLPFQLEALIPYQLDEVVVKPIYIPNGDETEALFFTVSKKNLENHISSHEDEGLSPEWVSAVPMALSRFASFTCPEHSTLVVFHIGLTKIQIVSQREGKILSHLTLHMGSIDLGKGMDQKVVAKLKREVDRALCFLAHKEERTEDRQVLFCGEMSSEIEALLSKDQGLISVHGEGRGGFSWDMVRPFAIPIGLALDSLKNDQMSIQFRQGDYVSKQCMQTLKRKVLCGICIAAALFLFTTIASELFFSKKERTLLGHVESLVERYEEDLPKLRHIAAKGNLKEVMEDIHHVLRTTKGKENYFASPPLVSNLLAFLSAHLLLEDIELTQIDYELKKYPTTEKPKEVYLPKVRVSFTTPVAKKARAFHDAIVENESIVNGSEEIDWKRNDDQYEIAFYLHT